MVTTAGQAQRRKERFRYIGLLVVGLGLVTTFGVQAILLMPTTYTATSAVSMRPTTATQQADVVSLVAHDYQVALGAPELAEQVADELDPSDERPEVSVSATQDAGSALVRVQVTSEDRDFAIAVANGLLAKGVELARDEETPRLEVVLRAGPAGVTSEPPRKLYLAALLTLAAMILAGGVYRIREKT